MSKKGGSSTPAAPDYAGAAQQTAAGNLANLKYQTQANRPNVYTPWGTETWTNDGTGNYTQNVSLTPELQSALDSQQRVSNNQSSLAEGLQGQVASTMANGFNGPDLSSYTSGVQPVDQNAPQWSDANRQAGIDAAYHSTMDLLEPKMQQDTTNLDAQLKLQGLQPGTEAYNNAAQNLARTQAQTRTQAANDAVQTGDAQANNDYASALRGYASGLQGQSQANSEALQNFQQAYATALQNYQMPLNNMNAVLNGNQVSMPTFPSFGQAGYTAGPDYLTAATNLGQYNSAKAAAGQAQSGGLMGNLAGLGMAYLGMKG